MTGIIIFLFTLFINPPSEGTNEIRWSADRKLTYSDFKGPVPPSSPWAATTRSNISFSYETVNGKLTNVAVYSTFSRDKSWMKTKIPVVLQHEQLHFDITEVFARRFYADVMKQQDLVNPKEKLNQLFSEANKLCGKMQEQYDSETQHGIVAEEQEEWTTRISEMLKSAVPYPSTD